MTAAEMTRVRDRLIANWPVAGSWPDATWDVWWEELRRFPPALVEYVLRAASAAEWPPAPAAVAGTCSEQLRRRARNAAIRAGAEQW